MARCRSRRTAAGGDRSAARARLGPRAASIVQLVTGLFIGLSFSGSGLIAWWRRPDSRTGRLLVLVGVTFFLGSLAEADAPLPFTSRLALDPLPIVALLHLVRAYPTGTLRTRVDR